jgi:hypothetical protein
MMVELLDRLGGFELVRYGAKFCFFVKILEPFFTAFFAAASHA